MKANKSSLDFTKILRNVRTYEIRLRKAITGSVAGDIQSMSKGSGLEFDEVRPYQYGDDIRTIDWNVSAKGVGTYIKIFKEEKDQQVLIMYDMSASTQLYNSAKLMKIKEIASVLYLSAVNQGADTRFAGFSDRLELVSKSTKNKTTASSNAMILLKSMPKSALTNITKALGGASNLLSKRSLVFVLSDFIDTDFETITQSMAKKHELVLIRITSEGQKQNIPLGIMPSRHSETGRWIISMQSVFGNFGINTTRIKEREDNFKKITQLPNIEFINLDTDADYVLPLSRFFKQRLKRR